MAAPGFQTKRPIGRALIVGNESARSQPLAAMQALGYECAELDDPYAAAAELHRRPMVYRAMVLSLASLFREELPIVAAIKRRLPHVEVWLTQMEGRQAAFAEAIRLGADGLLADDGALHRLGVAPTAAAPAVDPQLPHSANVEHLTHDVSADLSSTEPVLSADELKALLAEHPSMPPEDER